MMYLGSPDEVQFSLLVGFAELFLAACIAHGLFREHNPYGSDWITTTFRPITGFLLGTAFLDMRLRHRLFLTAMPSGSVVADPLPSVTPLWARAKRKEP
jgi:hypothetical protein